MLTKSWLPLLAGGMISFAAATAANADCASDLAALQGGVSKDGSLAPLQTESTGGAAATTGMAGDAAGSADAQGGIAKDGSQAPLAAEGGADVAASGQAAQAQQQAGGDARGEALARAQEALDAGDEDGCMKAVEEARNL